MTRTVDLRVRITAALLALAVLLALAPAADPAAAQEDDDPTPEVLRLAGEDRYGTAAAIATAAFDEADDVLLATGQNYPDSLAASALAGVVGAPLLLTRTASLPAATAEAIGSLSPETVHVLGGPAAVSAEVEDEVAALGVDTNRFAGDDRFETAAEIAGALADLGGVVGEVDGASTAFLASGRAFPDALAAGPGAYAGTHPVLLTEPGELPGATALALADLDVDQVAVLGGPAAVADPVVDAVEDLGIDTLRIAGDDRYETAEEVADFLVAALDFDPANVGLATGVDARGGADALAAAPYLGEAEAPLLLTASGTAAVPEATQRFLSVNAASVGTLHVFGGEVAVDDDAVAQAQTAVTNPGFVTSLSWINEVDDSGPEPEFFAGEVDGFGEAVLTFNRPDGTIDFQISVGDGVTPEFADAPGAHIHEGALDENGPVVVAFDDGTGLQAGQGTIEGQIGEEDFAEGTTVEGIVADLENYYVNVHNEPFPPGAVRGQLPFGAQERIASQPVTFEVELATDNEIVPDTGEFGVDTEASGSVELAFDPLADTITYEGQATIPDDDSFLDAPGAHIHQGRIDENGPVIVFLATDEELEAADGAFSGTITSEDFTDAGEELMVFDLLLDPGDFYVNVHSEDFPPGIVRGQLPDGGQDRLPDGAEGSPAPPADGY